MLLVTGLVAAGPGEGEAPSYAGILLGVAFLVAMFAVIIGLIALASKFRPAALGGLVMGLITIALMGLLIVSGWGT